MKSIKADNKETRGVFIINFEYIQHNNSVFLLLYLNMLLHFRKDFSHFIFLTKCKKRKIIQILFHVFTAEACSGTRSNIWDEAFGFWIRLCTVHHCVKSVHIRSFLVLIFLHADWIWTRKIPNMDTFSGSVHERKSRMNSNH